MTIIALENRVEEKSFDVRLTRARGRQATPVNQWCSPERLDYQTPAFNLSTISLVDKSVSVVKIEELSMAEIFRQDGGKNFSLKSDSYP